ncbi:hypothetical protein [Rhodobium gokarnense]|uniref:Uncharacterized protein n=1 Tax=Rhodobium gokarnense TaxID=364296 RepID=A0ABT3H9A6_9HYPH|nr:hypothetical protein [Rhodobium gokarnense]MCW2306988.1 hypothetical protein [Rhodobium gokarnense]
MPSNRTLVISAAFVALFMVVAGVVVIANRPDPNARPYLQIQGGGFIFNYRVAEMFYGFTARIMRPISVGTVIEATFEDPAGGDPIVVAQRIGSRVPTVMVRSPAVHGVEKGKPYDVTIRLLDRDDGTEMARYQRSFSSNIGEEVMPKKPLTIGPGYHRPPPE